MALAEILDHKRREVALRKSAAPLSGFRAALAASDRSLADALRRPHTGFVLECKQASPSRGLIRSDFDPAAIARSYAPFADAISVLCDERFFRGSHEHLAMVRRNAPQPVLCKDFVVDPYQVYEARRFGADAILLMCSVLDDEGLATSLAATRELGMDALVEVHDESELDRALALGAPILGINNRDLRTLRIDLATSARLAPRVPRDRLVVCESGMESHADIRGMRERVDAFLVGTSLMREPDLDHAVRRLVFGRAKVCGLRDGEHARAAHASGATHGGLVFWDPSPRAATLADAERVRAAAPLAWVGVFVDAPAATVAEHARALALAAVQLHGSEDRAYLDALRPLLPQGCAIWQAVRVGAPGTEGIPTRASSGADRVLCDAYRPDAPGGTGQRFEWALLAEHPERSELVLSGGLTPENAAEADALGCWALDASSGLERAPGEKDPARIAAFFAALRGSRVGSEGV